MSETTVDRVDPSNEADVAQIAPVIAAIVDSINAEGGENALPAKMSADDVVALIRRLGERGGVFYCREGDDVVAFATVQPDEQDPETAIMGTWVHAAHRRKGHGTELARCGAEFARDAGYKKLRGTIPASNEPALSFFSSIGPIVRLQGGDMGYELPV